MTESIAFTVEKVYTKNMPGFQPSLINMILLFILIIIAIAILYLVYKHCQKTDKRLNEIEDTYGYLKFLDDANQKIYKEYLKEKAKNEKSPRQVK